MGRSVAADAKVVDTRDQATTEQPRPELIDDDPRSQRIGPLDQPARKIQATRWVKS